MHSLSVRYGITRPYVWTALNVTLAREQVFGSRAGEYTPKAASERYFCPAVRRLPEIENWPMVRVAKSE